MSSDQVGIYLQSKPHATTPEHMNKTPNANTLYWQRPPGLSQETMAWFRNDMRVKIVVFEVVSGWIRCWKDRGCRETCEWTVYGGQEAAASTMRRIIGKRLGCWVWADVLHLHTVYEHVHEHEHEEKEKEKEEEKENRGVETYKKTGHVSLCHE